MRKLKIFILILVLAVLVVMVALFFIGYFRPKPAGLLVDTSPQSSVFLDGQLVGKTPYETTREGTEIVVKLVPDTPELSENTFETKVKLSPGIKTIIKREFGLEEQSSQGEIMSFEKVGREASLAIITIPDATQIAIDGKVAGFSPLKVNSISPGDHQVVVSSTGFTERVFTVRTYERHKLTAVVQLAKLPVTLEEVVEPQEAVKQVLVEIGTTSTGFLRVREKPSSGSAELTRVTPGQKFPFISEDTEVGWFEIEYESGKNGWVSGEFTKKIEE